MSNSEEEIQRRTERDNRVNGLIDKYRDEVNTSYAKAGAAQGQGDRQTAEVHKERGDTYNKVIRDLTNLKKVI